MEDCDICGGEVKSVYTNLSSGISGHKHCVPMGYGSELKALRKDYQKLLVQVQAELVQKEYYKKQYSMMLSLISIKDIKISRLELALRDTAREL